MKAIERITSPLVPEPGPGRFSNCLKVDGIAYLAGMTGEDPATQLLPASTYEQAQHIFRKLVALVEAAGGQAADIVKLTVFVTDIDRAQAAQIQQARAEVFSGNFPASTLVQVAALFDPAMKVEIEAIAHIGASTR